MNTERWMSTTWRSLYSEMIQNVLVLLVGVLSAKWISWLVTDVTLSCDGWLADLGFERASSSSFSKRDAVCEKIQNFSHRLGAWWLTLVVFIVIGWVDGRGRKRSMIKDEEELLSSSTGATVKDRPPTIHRCHVLVSSRPSTCCCTWRVDSRSSCMEQYHNIITTAIETQLSSNCQGC